ncbi:MAG: 4-alpha-glucanotransferase [Candidatus Adiutrix sp.]|jgi:4-alpha-glucanotransferase|nr:4-alpha-glucanotransferase [Candidatus Adiutrix sp.]
MSRISEGWRAGGLLLHISSLATPYGVGDLGPAAHRAADFISRAGFHFWQVLPLSPTAPGLGNSPYSAYSAFAGNPLLISPDLLVRDGWLIADEARAAELSADGPVDFERVSARKTALLDLAFERAEARLETNAGFQDFAWRNGTWMNDYAFFMAAKHHFGGAGWLGWPEDLRHRDEGALRLFGTRLARSILREKFSQYIFFSQLAELKELLHQKGLGLIGDAPIYVNHDSSDVWAQPGLYHLGEDGRSTALAGVPPDYFARDGQLWGNPLFNWEEHARDGFNWWKNRLWHELGLYDWLRLDHFRAFAAFWSVPAGAETAAGGAWHPGPGADLFAAASADGPLNIIAEDLGIITPDVTALRQKFGYPGMRVLQFGFGEDFGLSAHAPFRVEPDNAVYTGTHDNNTTRGWFRREADELKRRQLAELAGGPVTEENAAWALIRLAWFSPAALALTPAQDLLNLDDSARLNVPGTAFGNWSWRLSSQGDLFDDDRLADRLADLAALSGRDNQVHPNILTY